MSLPRVLQIGKFYAPFRGGMESHLEALCRGLRDRFDVQVLVSSGSRATSREVRDGIPVRRLATPFSITSAPVVLGLASAIREARPDLVHLHLPHPSAVLSMLASGYRGPLVITYHSDVVRQRVMSGVFKPFLDSCLRMAAVILVTSREYMESSRPLQPHVGRCRVVPLGVPLGVVLDPADPLVTQVRAQYGDRIVLAVGRFVSYKGFDVLLDAMHNLDARLLLVGDGPDRATLERRAQNVPGDRVAFLGSVPDARPFFAAADVFVLPSTTRAEAFGLVQLEAMLNTVPVINTWLDTGVPFVSPHGVTGLTVAPGDAGALASAIRELLDDPDRRAALAAAGRARVLEHFGAGTMIQRIAATYDEVLGRAARVSSHGQAAV